MIDHIKFWLAKEISEVLFIFGTFFVIFAVAVVAAWLAERKK